MLWGPLTKPRQTVMDISPPDIVKRRSMASGGMTAEIVRATRREKIELRFCAPLHLLVVHDQGVRRDGDTFVEGLPKSTLRDARRKLIFVPAGHEYREWQEPKVLMRAVYFYFDPARMPKPPETDTPIPDLVPRLFFEDATLSDTALKVTRLIESTSSGIGPYFEALCMVLAHELVRRNAGPICAEIPARGGLAPSQQRTVVSYIEAHLAEPISLSTLAGLVRLSPHYFCRAFKQSFGMPPHRYHNSRRIEQAKALLAKPSSSVTEIGLTMGFQETSSFTAVFHKTTGLTPTAYRRSLI
jgi:AraC family transcriptional regulator